MDCTTANEQLLAHEREDLIAADVALLRVHLTSCPACRYELRAHRGLRTLLDQISIEPQAGFVAQVMAAVRDGGAAAGVHTGVALAAQELRGAVDAQVLGVRRAVFAVRQRTWILSVSVAVHAAVLFLLAAIVTAPGGSGKPSATRSSLVINLEDVLPADEAEHGSFGDEGRRSGALGVSGPGGELDWDAEDFVRDPGPDSESPGQRVAHRQPYLPPAPEGEGDMWALLPTEDTDDLPETKRIGQLEGLLGLRAEPADRRRAALARYASMRLVSSAIDEGLAWLSREQDDDGSWSPVGEEDRDGRQLGEPSLRVAVTALAVLPFLAEGIHSESSSGYGQEVVARAIAYLEQNQDRSTGGIGHTEGGRSMFNHALASAALGENLALIAQATTREGVGPATRLKDPKSAYQTRARVVQRALSFLRRAQIRPASAKTGSGDVAGGWGYRPDSRVTDTNVSAWGVQALLAYEAAARVVGRRGGRKLEQAYSGARSWLRAYTDPLTGRVGYDGFRQYGRYGPMTLTAVGLMTNLLTGAAVDRRLADAQEKMILADPPSFSLDAADGPDFCRGYFSVLALYLKDSKSAPFRKWYRTAVEDLVELQVHHDDPDEESLAGSWPMLCRWSQYGGRVYNTSLATLVLQTPYRYAPD